ncbi:HD-GYP domain-containing protein [Effusibacillus dendaii]|uniref:HD-GYP domain-containing protein n=1 Tax=Effusibacillus dendaii TaxID=2743772 RepID=A0A7I8DB04_9BACL|nr:HD-GYP domain-containing protein [Effusibacillus dendaii]BCJ86016.1 hypothetical protein skT53_10010 [Effusibacillus dendaii]
MINEATEQIKEIFLSLHSSEHVPIDQITSDIIPAIKQATENTGVFKLLAELQSKDDYTYRHNIAVGVIATLIGKWLNLDEPDLSHLTLAATLHDIGKVKIPLEIFNKPGRLTDIEYRLIKKHAQYGYNILKNSKGIPHRVALVALQHHEREDGGGYPAGLTGEHIDTFSKIVAVADVFHAMTSKRTYHEARPFYQVISEMREGGFGQLDGTITLTFIQKIMEQMVGEYVTLTNGRQAKVILINQYDPANPLVQVGNQFIDLSKDTAVHIGSPFT